MNVTYSLTVLLILSIVLSCRKDSYSYEVYEISQYDLYGVAVYSGDTVVAVGGRKYEQGVLFVKAGSNGQWQLKQRTDAALNTVAFRYGWRGFAAGYRGIILSGYDIWDTAEVLNSPSFSVFYDILDLDTIVYFVGGGEGFLKGTILRAKPGFDWFEELYLPYVLRSICFDGKYLYAGSVGRIYISTNGRVWDSIFVGNDFYIGAVKILNECYFIGARGTIVTIIDRKENLLHERSFLAMLNIVSVSATKGNLVALTGSGKVMLYNGKTWKTWISLPTTQCFDIHCDEQGTCYTACEKGKLFMLDLN